MKYFMLILFFSLFLVHCNPSERSSDSVSSVSDSEAGGQVEADAEASASETTQEEDPQDTKPDKVFEVKCNCIRDRDGQISPVYATLDTLQKAIDLARKNCVEQVSPPQGMVFNTIAETWTFQPDSCVVDELTK